MLPIHRACAAILLVLVPAVANGDPPLSSPVTLTVGGGVTVSDLPVDDYRSDPARTFRAGPGLQMDIAYRLRPALAIGAHGGVAVSHGMDLEHYSMSDLEWEYSYYSIELGVMAQVMLVDRVWLSPWIGVHKLSSDHHLPGWADSIALGYGIVIGGDVYRIGAHRAALFVSATRSARDDPRVDFGGPSPAFLAFVAGAAYHY